MKGITLSWESIVALENATYTVVLPRKNNDVAQGDVLDLFVERTTDSNTQLHKAGKVFVVSCWTGKLSDIPARIINECPNPLHHTYNGLFCYLRQTFVGLGEETEVIAIRFVKA